MIDIDSLIKEAMKSHNADKLRAYKNLKAEIQAFKTAKDAKPYDEVAEVKLISKMCKKLEDAIKQFQKARRDDLVTEYSNELRVLQLFIPAPVGSAEMTSTLWRWVCKMNFYNVPENEYIVVKIPKKEMGNAIKYLKSEYPTADGKLISEIVKKHVE